MKSKLKLYQPYKIQSEVSDMQVKLNGNDFFTVTSQFGVTDSIHTTPHTGLDLAMNIGTKLFAPTDGLVTKVVDYGSESIGKGIYIETEGHQTVIMGHLSDIKTQVGAKVHEGDFVAYSGSTGHSTGGHLHLGLKDADGTFINPKSLIDGHEGAITKMIQNGKVPESQEVGLVDGVKGFMEFVSDVKANGLFNAIYGKSFFEVCKDFFSQLGHDIGVFILGNGDLFFLLPAILFMGGTWLVGRNKFTKWIIPLWFAYFITKVFYYILKG